MRPVTDTVSSQTSGTTIPVDWRENDFKLTLVADVTGTLTYSVQFTVDNIQDPDVTPTWFDADTLSGLSADANGGISFPVRAVRLDVTAYTSGSVTLTVIQSGGR